MQAALVSLPTLITEVMQCCKEQRSGCFHIVTDQNHKVSLGLLKGNIVSMQYRIRRGQRALEDIRKVNAGRYDFKEGAEVTIDSPPLPETVQILKWLGVTEEELVTFESQAKQVTVARPTLNASARTVLQGALVKYVGPVAPIMSKPVFDVASSLSEAINMLAAKIPNASQAQAFVDEVRAELS